MKRISEQKVAVLALTSALLAVAAGCSAAEPATDARQPLQWGVYQIYTGAERFAQHLKNEVNRLASKPNYVMFYRDLGRPFPTDGIDVIYNTGATPIISLELWRWHDAKTEQLPRILAGEWDEFFRTWAQHAKRDGRRVLLRFGFEFNGDWFSWGGKPEEFKTAWRRARDIFDEVGVKNVEWVWSANVTSHPTVPANDMHNYYPGDKYVDWVAVDGYNWGDEYKDYHHWTSFEKVFSHVFDEFAKRYPRKPLMIAECGSPEGTVGQKAQWVRDAHAAAQRHAQLKVIIWFNFDKRREGELNFRLDSSVDALRAFNETFAVKRE